MTKSPPLSDAPVYGQDFEAQSVPFTALFLDPNNPRIAPESPPGYADPDALFDADTQRQLEANVREVYDVSGLETSILAQGWVPYDPMIVWEHPKRPGNFVVLEGNTRTATLRGLRDTLKPREVELLSKLEKAPGMNKADIKQKKNRIAQIDRAIEGTQTIRVFKVEAADGDELLAKLPRVMSVRHLINAQGWKPYPTNLYIFSLYERLFHARYGEDEALRIEPVLIEEIANSVSYKPLDARRAVQAASAFTRFKNEYTDRLPDGERFRDEDHYFFQLVLENPYARDRFGFGERDLRLAPDMEETLFQWAFAKPRPRSGSGSDGNENVWYNAENIRKWCQMKRYDDKNQTNFAGAFDVEDPESAPLMQDQEPDFLAHKAQSSPISALAKLVNRLKKIEADTLIAQQEQLLPMLTELQDRSREYRKMIEAATAD